MTVPKALYSYFSTLSIARNRWRIYPVSGSRGIARPGDVVTLDVPQQLCDFDTFALGFDLTTKPIGTGTGTTTYCKLSANAHHVLEQLVVEQAGAIIDQGFQLTNRVQALLHDLSNNITHDLTVGAILHNAVNKKPAATEFHTDERFFLTQFLGFLGSVQPRQLDVSSIGNLRLTFRLADASIFMSDQPAYKSDISYGNFIGYVDTIDVLDGGEFYNGQQAQIQRGEYFCPFDKFYTITTGTVDTGNDTGVMNVNVNSLDWLLGGFISSPDPAKPNEAVQMGALDETDIKTPWRAAGTITGVGGNNSISLSQMQINGVQYPSWPASPTEAYMQTMISLNKLHDKLGTADWLNSINRWQFFGCAHIIPLSDVAADPVLRLKSGLNTVGSQTVVQYNTTTAVAGRPPKKFIVAKSTALLNILPGRLVQVLQ